MTAQELARVAQGFAVMAAYFRVQMDDTVLRMYAEDLSDLPFEQVMSALVTFRKDPKNRFMPLPAQIRDIVEPVVTPEQRAREIAARIEGAIVKFGHPNRLEAKEFIGEEGWAVVERYGGWGHLCENHGLSISPASFHAQVREQLTTTFKHQVGDSTHAIAGAQILKAISGKREGVGA